MEIESEKLDQLLVLVKNIHGYDFTGYSKASLSRRVNRYVTMNRLDSIDKLFEQVKTENGFVSFLEEVTVNVTEMFRDPSFFLALREKVIPKLKTYPYIKVWTAGCSTGEEVYSLAILLKEEGLYDKAKIYATDINQKVLAKAKEGVFHLGNMKDYTQNYIRSGGKGQFSDYYHAKYGRAIFDASLKKNIVFSLHNLVSDSSFNEFNLILCRNVMIYFGRDLQEDVLQLFLQSLSPFGYLALGTKETLALSRYRDNFEIIDKNEKVYRRIR